MKSESEKYDVAIAGGGLAGLSAAILLAREGFRVILIERKSYPFHRVCGEYISEESRPFLESLGIPLNLLNLPLIRKLLVSSPDGAMLETALRPGGFGISRYRLDAILAGIARDSGVHLLEATTVHNIRYENGEMVVSFRQQEIKATVAIGSFGKRANLDISWKRSFALAKQSKLNNFVGVKYHIQIDEPPDRIALHNFKDGYCGISQVEDGLFCLCYLTTAHNLRLCDNSIARMESELLKKNPHLARIFNQGKMVWPAPQVISQVSFMAKSQVEDHVLLVGDAAGMITPLCGNGMSMALHGSKLAVEQVVRLLKQEISREEMERHYQKSWQHQFSKRLQAGRIIQRFFGDPVLSGILVKAGHRIPALTRFLVSQTHGDQY
jgi:flavin-dependent dehydrogenase